MIFDNVDDCINLRGAICHIICYRHRGGAVQFEVIEGGMEDCLPCVDVEELQF